MSLDEKEAPLLTGIRDLLGYRELIFWIIDVGNVYDGERHFWMKVVVISVCCSR